MSNIAAIIDECVLEARNNGYNIVPHSWGVYPVNDVWAASSRSCCPLGAVLLEYLALPPEGLFWDGPFHFIYSGKDVRLNPTFSIIHLFGVDYNWVKSFWHGIMNSNIGYYSNQEARDLGFKYYLEINSK